MSFPTPANISNQTYTQSSAAKTIFIALYSSLFCIGEVGNLIVIITLSLMCATARKIRSRSKGSSHHHTLTFVIALSSTDSLSLFTLPFTIYGYYSRTWQFGEIPCKLFFVVEALNKILSPLLLSALAFDRFMHVKNPTSGYISSTHVTKLIIAILVTVTLTVMAPCIHYSGINENHQCADRIPSHVLPYSVLLIFCVGFCVPGVLITTFYGIVVFVLGQTRGAARKRRARQRKVAVMLGILIMFYTLCYTPYWMFTVIWPVFVHVPPNKIIRRLQNLVHILPYINSSTNPILYALLNTEIRRKAKQLRRRRNAMKSVNIPLLAMQAMMPMLGLKYPTQNTVTLTKEDSSEEDLI